MYTLSLHDALPILQVGFAVVMGGDYHKWNYRQRYNEVSLCHGSASDCHVDVNQSPETPSRRSLRSCDTEDRKSTRLNSSHPSISYAVSCLKKKSPPDHPYSRPYPGPTPHLANPSYPPPFFINDAQYPAPNIPARADPPHSLMRDSRPAARA